MIKNGVLCLYPLKVLEQIKQFKAVQPEQCFVDRGYRGHEVKDTKVFISGQKRGVTRSIKKALKRRSAIEPEIGHMKNDGRLDRCYLKGAVGDAINVVMMWSNISIHLIKHVKLHDDVKYDTRDPNQKTLYR